MPNTVHSMPMGKAMMSHACVVVWHGMACSWRHFVSVCCIGGRFHAFPQKSRPPSQLNSVPAGLAAKRQAYLGFGRCIGCFLNGGHFVGTYGLDVA